MLKQKTLVDKELEEIRRQQHLQHQILAKNSDVSLSNLNSIYSRSMSSHENISSKMVLMVTLQNRSKLNGKLMKLTDIGVDRWRIVLKDNDKHHFTFDFNYAFQSFCQIDSLIDFLNEKLLELYDEAVLEFPLWLANRNSKENAIYTLAEIEKEYKAKKARFGTWRFAALVGLFTNTHPQSAKFNKIDKIEVGPFGRKADIKYA